MISQKQSHILSHSWTFSVSEHRELLEQKSFVRSSRVRFFLRNVGWHSTGRPTSDSDLTPIGAFWNFKYFTKFPTGHKIYKLPISRSLATDGSMSGAPSRWEVSPKRSAEFCARRPHKNGRGISVHPHTSWWSLQLWEQIRFELLSFQEDNMLMDKDTQDDEKSWSRSFSGQKTRHLSHQTFH